MAHGRPTSSHHQDTESTEVFNTIPFDHRYEKLLHDSGQDYFHALVNFLGELLQTDIVLVGSVRLAETERIRVQSLYDREGQITIEEYEACNKPCLEVVTLGVTKVIGRDLVEQYPNEPAFKNLGLNS